MTVRKIHNVLMQSAGVAEDLVAPLEQLLRAIRHVASAGQLSWPAAAVVGRLMREGPQRLTDLAAAERVSQPGMTQLVSRLERAGLVIRRPGTDDGRTTVVHVTAAGRRVAEQRRAERTRAISDLLEQLAAEDRAAIAAAIPALERLADLTSGTVGDAARARHTAGARR
jgi:DNA-binding MarR family transcriptional regulator